MTILTELATAMRTIGDRASTSVVSVGRNGRGTGVVIAPGRVLTNAHNLRDQTTQLTFSDGRTTQGELVGIDPDGDLAVVGADTGAITPLPWSEHEPRPGDIAFAVSAGSHRSRITWGTITAVDGEFRGPRGRRIGGVVEHTAPLPRGSSGGPLLDEAGAIVALNTHRMDHGFYLARPATAELRQRIDELVAGRSPTRRTLGVALVPSHVAARLRKAVALPERDGLLVRAVVDGSAADHAGVRQGDLLVSAGDDALRTADDLHAALARLGAGEGIRLGVVRGTDELIVEVTFDDDDVSASGGGEADPRGE